MIDPQRELIINSTRSWIGTPYHHHASKKNIGCDCLGLVRGVYKEIYGFEPAPIIPYSADWAEVSGEETLINGAKEHLNEIPSSSMQNGDVLIFRFRRWMVAKHAAILVTPSTMVHAIQGSNVEEVSLGSWWRRHIAATFSFIK